ncbi:MAG: Ig domain-containing protein [Desulfobacterota bacterium]|nr:Ig domain-containing protein [Thermodesulfobacteriota bacterium]
MKIFLRIFLTIGLLLSFFAAGCKGEKPEPKINNKQSQAANKKLKTQKPSFSHINQPPKIVAAEILPNPAYGNTDLRVETKAEDPEGDWVELHYQWIFFKEKENGIRIAEEIPGENTSILSHEKFVHGDIIAVRITPVDGEGNQGETYQTRFLMVKNSPPEIISSPPEAISGSVFAYQVIAQDLDNDPVTFSLGENSPEGMTIDSATGVFTWTIPDKATGKYTVRVNGDDGQGGTCYQRFTLSLAYEVK